MRSVAIASLAGLAATSLTACGAPGTVAPSTQHTVAARRAVRPILDGGGIGSVRFRQSPAEVAVRLGRLFGPPVGARQVPHGYLRAYCGFYWETWDGIGASSKGQLFAAQLGAYFRNSRFIGYVYDTSNFQTVTSGLNQHTRPGMVLTTTKGLAVGDPVARGNQLYGRAFVATTRMQGTPPNRRLPRVPAWGVATASGRIEGWIGNTVLIVNGYRTATRAVNVQRAIHSIGAGVLPNTPCHT